MSDRLTILEGDSLEVLPTLDAESVDAIATDPPYGISFMGHAWDQPGAQFSPLRAGPGHSPGHPREREARAAGDDAPTSMEAGRYDLSLTANQRFQTWCQAWGAALLRVAKPGAHALVFGGTRTYHRMAAGLEDAGWEVRDCLVWGYAQGMPKNLDVSKAIDRTLGAQRERIAYDRKPGMARSWDATGTGTGWNGEAAVGDVPVTPEAAAWAGWGTALKPAWEPIVLLRKPFAGSVARNVLARGTGGLNIGATTIPLTDEDREAWAKAGGFLADGASVDHAAYAVDFLSGVSHKTGIDLTADGRWPANIAVTDEVLERGVPGVVIGGADAVGSFSRFFIIPKAGRGDREPLVRDGLALATKASYAGGIAGTDPVSLGFRTKTERANLHPTVKPVELMRHLVRLVTPPGGVVLDPFLGSGTTAVAAEIEGFGCIGIERDPGYAATARARVLGIDRGLGLVADVAPGPVRRAPLPRPVPAAVIEASVAGQAGLFDSEEEVS